MAPVRLESALWTPEDVAAFRFRIYHQARHSGHFWDMWEICLDRDRHDADMMFCWLAAPENSPRYWTLYYLSGRHLE
jgi:hypothetical protein